MEAEMELRREEQQSLKVVYHRLKRVCICCSVGVMLSMWTKIFYYRAAVCGTEDRGCSVTSVDDGRSERRELQKSSREMTHGSFIEFGRITWRNHESTRTLSVYHVADASTFV